MSNIANTEFNQSDVVQLKTMTLLCSNGERSAALPGRSSFLAVAPPLYLVSPKCCCHPSLVGFVDRFTCSGTGPDPVSSVVFG
jgi:hypothetical protein